MAGKDKPKVSGLSFNLFALIAVLVLLPISTAFVSSLADNHEEYESITTKVNQNRLWELDPKCQDNINSINDDVAIFWLNKGTNATAQYEIRDNTNDPYLYEEIWDENLFYYRFLANYCGGDTFYRNDIEFSVGVDNHRWLYDNYLDGSSPNYDGFIGYTGKEYGFRVNDNMFQYIRDDKDISGLSFEFIDYQTGYNRDNTIFQNITLSMAIELNTVWAGQLKTLTFDNFETTQFNRKCYQYANQYGVGGTASLFTGTLPEICHLALDLEFNFNPFEVIEISEELNRNYDYMWANVYIDDIIFDENLTGQNQYNVLGNNIFVSQNPLPFAGDDNNGFNFEVRYTDTSKTNFWLSGGTFILGVALFLLAIASTPYWNPVINFFQEGSK